MEQILISLVLFSAGEVEQLFYKKKHVTDKTSELNKVKQLK